MKAWTRRFRNIRRDQSYPAFTHASSDRDLGNGDPANGDTIGWINRGMDWRDIEDEPDHYAITILAEFPGTHYPITSDVTLRRLQRFKAAPGAKLRVTVGDAAPRAVFAGPSGRITISDVAVSTSAGTRIVIRRR